MILVSITIEDEGRNGIIFELVHGSTESTERERIAFEALKLALEKPLNIELDLKFNGAGTLKFT
jgi:hypothetical protein